MPGVSTQRTFKANKNQLYLEVGGVMLVGITIVFWNGERVSWFLALFLIGLLTYRLFFLGGIIKKVTLHDGGVDIVPLFPWFRRRRWQAGELATYKSVALTGRFKGRPFMGILAPKEGQTEIIWASGTDQFHALDELLSQLLPAPQEREESKQ